MKLLILIFISFSSYGDSNILVDRFILESEATPTINCTTFLSNVKTKDACELVDNPPTDNCVSVPIAPCELLQLTEAADTDTISINYELLVQNSHDATPTFPTITSSDFQKVIVTDDFGVAGQVLQSSGFATSQVWTPYTFPFADGTNNQILTTDGVGALTFKSSIAGHRMVSFSFNYKRNSTNTDTCPPQARWRRNNGTPSSVTFINIHREDETNNARTDANFLSMIMGDRLFIQDHKGSANNEIYEATGAPNTNGDCTRIPVAHISNNGEIAAGDENMITMNASYIPL